MKPLILYITRILALATLLAACSPQTQIIKLYDNTDASDRPYERFFVVSIAGDSKTRRQLEELIADNLRAARALAVAAHTEIGSSTTLLRKDIDEAARRTGSDAILVSHIISVDTTVDMEEGRVDVIAECREGDPADYFLYDYDELKQPDTVRITHTVVAVTNLYDASSGERLWTIQSTCFDKATMNEVLLDESEAIARQLRIDGLIG